MVYIYQISKIVLAMAARIRIVGKSTKKSRTHLRQCGSTLPSHLSQILFFFGIFAVSVDVEEKTDYLAVLALVVFIMTNNISILHALNFFMVLFFLDLQKRCLSVLSV